MKVALITGSSRGIGKDIAKVFAKNGYSVVICYNKSKEDAQNLCEEIIKFGGRAIISKVDVTNIEDIKNMLKYTIYCFGHIDVLINNAGIAHKALLIDEDMNEIDSIIDTNLKGTINVTKFALPYMLKNGGGKIINISSIWGSEGASCESVYSASKAGIIGFTRSIAKEYEKIIKVEDKRGATTIGFYERFEFYRKASEAYLIIVTGEKALYANVMLQKGVL